MDKFEIRLPWTILLLSFVLVQGCDHHDHKNVKTSSAGHSKQRTVTAGNSYNDSSSAKVLDDAQASGQKLPSVIEPETKESAVAAQEQRVNPTPKPKTWGTVPEIKLPEELSGEKLIQKGFQKDSKVERYTRIMRVDELKPTLGVSPESMKGVPSTAPGEPHYVINADGWVVVARVLPVVNENGLPRSGNDIHNPETRISVSVSQKPYAQTK